jgi:hypothetical protein
MKCYAASLGDCSNIQSKEHYISKGIWQSPVITFEGLDWLNGESKYLPVKNVALRILCTTHNECLSHLDTDAQRLFETGAKFHDNQHKRAKLKRGSVWKTDRASFNGYLLERLFAKIAVGVLQEQPTRKWHLTNLPAITPPDEIVKAIFRRIPFMPPMGLYFINSVGDRLINEDRVSINTMFHPTSKGFIGAVIAIRTWQFFINLSDVNINNYSMESMSGKLVGIGGEAPICRLRTINFGTGKGSLSGRLDIDW